MFAKRCEEPLYQDIKEGLGSGYIHVYTGEGKGKTTAALGLCFRASGAGLRVKVFQLMKRRYCSEHRMAERLGLEVRLLSEGLDLQEACRRMWIQIQEAATEGSCDLLCVDELGEALRRSFISEDEVRRLFATKADSLELVVTGRGLLGRFDDQVDLITEMRKHKHYYDEGVCARRGIEY